MVIYKAKNRWRKFWQGKNDPLHRAYTDNDFERIASEIKLLFNISGTKFNSVLELGCGNGEFYERLGFSDAHYVGVDISDAMIKKFRDSYPKAELYIQDLIEFESSNRFDLVFTSGVIQYLRLDEFALHIRNMSKLLNPSGTIIHSFVPWKTLRWQYLKGNFSPLLERKPSREIIAALLAYFRIKDDGIGNWFNISDVRNVVKYEGLKVSFYGSLYYPYRFHMLIEPAID